MLDRLVRPLIRSQIQLLSQTQSANTRLVGMISEWLGHLGMQANVTELHSRGEQIQISLRVDKPSHCSETEWQQILKNLSHPDDSDDPDIELTYDKMSSSQRSQTYRLLAHMLKAGNAEVSQSWESLRPYLLKLGMEESLLSGIKAALKSPTSLDLLLEDVQTDVAVFVLSKAIGIALIDQRINQDEDTTLKAIYGALEKKLKATPQS